MYIGQQRPWLLRQVEIDTHFLQRLSVLDYSLLIAHQPLHNDERHQSLSFATLIMRTKMSVSSTTFYSQCRLFYYHVFSLVVHVAVIYSQSTQEVVRYKTVL